MTVVFKPLSVAALYLRKRAMDIGRRVVRGGVVNDIQELFLLRAVGTGQLAIVTALEIPPKFGGGFGGPNSGIDFFTTTVSAEYGQTFNALFKPAFKFEEAVPVPTLTDDPKTEVPFGGRVEVGTPPAWTDPRDAFNATVGQFYVYPSAIIQAVCPTYDTGADPDARTLLLARINGYMPFVTFEPGMVGADRPAVNGDPHAERPESIGVIEFSRAALGGTVNDLLFEASACLEWGSLNGIVSAELREFVASAQVSTRFAMAGYAITDNGEEEVPRYTSEVTWQSDIAASTLPILDQPEAVPATGAVAPGYNFPVWASTHGFPDGKPAADGQFSFPDAANCRMWAPNAGYVVPPESAMMILQVISGINAADFNVEAWTGDPGTPTYAFFDVPAEQAQRYITYVINVSTVGVLSYVKLDEFVYSRYDPAYFDQLERVDYRPYLGMNAFDGTPRLICSKLTNHYEILPADPDIPGPPRIQGELERKVLSQYNSFRRLDDLEFVVVSSAGVETVLDMDVYYPVLYTLDTDNPGVSPQPTDGRTDFADTELASSEPRFGQAIPAPFCQYAPGVVACLLSPKVDYTLGVHTLRVGIFDIATGNMLAISPALFGYGSRNRFNLSCYEQGTVDEEGGLASHARLLLMVSSANNTPERGDGIFAINELSTVTWISRELSNTPLHYIGNKLVPATIGVSTNLIGVKPTPLA